MQTKYYSLADFKTNDRVSDGGVLQNTLFLLKASGEKTTYSPE